MNVKSHTRLMAIALLSLLAVAMFPASASANHSWNGYHWARTSNPFTIKLGDNTSGTWKGYLGTVSSDWSTSAVLDTTIVAGRGQPKTCRPTTGRVEVCNASYGNTGWLGIAQIWLSGTHIAQGTVKNNDYYFGNSTYQYNNEAEKLHVICQEVGHTFGLGHQDESGISLNTCMDYYHNTSATDTVSTHPNTHDYDQLASIYSHLDSTTTIRSLPAAMTNGDFTTRASWGKLVNATGREHTYVRDFGGGNQIVTFVIWTQ